MRPLVHPRFAYVVSGWFRQSLVIPCVLVPYGVLVQVTFHFRDFVYRSGNTLRGFASCRLLRKAERWLVGHFMLWSRLLRCRSARWLGSCALTAFLTLLSKSSHEHVLLLCLDRLND